MNLAVMQWEENVKINSEPLHLINLEFIELTSQLTISSHIKFDLFFQKILDLHEIFDINMFKKF